MADGSGSAAQALAGNPAGGAAAAAGAAGTQAPAQDAGQKQAGGGDGAAKPWWDGMPENLSGLVQTKGWKDPAAAVESYANLEKLVGTDRLAIPKDDADHANWDKVYNRLGRPDRPEGYGLKAPEGADPAFAKAASEVMHKAGLSAKQAQALAGWWGEQQAAALKGFTDQRAKAAETDMAALKAEWGQTYDAEIEGARRAARAYGLDEAKLTKIEDALGTAELLRLFAKIGKAQGEHAPADGAGSGGFGMTPAAAKAEIAALKVDAAFNAAYLDGSHVGHKDAVARMERLHKAAFPET